MLKDILLDKPVECLLLRLINTKQKCAHKNSYYTKNTAESHQELVDTLFRQHPAYHITHPRVEQLCRNGNAFTVKTPLDGGIYRVYGTEGDFLCLSRLENGQMTSIKNFFGA